MGVEYRHYLVPENRMFRPSPEQLVALCKELVTQEWLPRPAAGSDTYPFIESDEDGDTEDIATHAYVRDGESMFRVPAMTFEWAKMLPRDCQIVFASENNSLTGTSYPFTTQQYTDAGLSWTVELCEDLAYDPSSTAFSGAEASLGKRVARWFRRQKERSPVLCACGARLDYVTSVRDPIEPARIRVSCTVCARVFDPSSYPAVIQDGYGSALPIAGGLARRFALIIDCEKSLPGSDGTFGLKPGVVAAVESALDEHVVEIPFWY